MGTSSSFSVRAAATVRRCAAPKQAAAARKQRRPGGAQHGLNQAATLVGELRRCRGIGVGGSARARDGWQQSKVELGMTRA